MKVLHVISSLRRSGGGPARSVQGLVAGLNRAGTEAWLMTIRKSEQPWVSGIYKFVNGRPFENVVLQIKPDIVHIHGIWSLELHRCAIICRRWNIPYVIAPRGMLEPWSLKQKKWKKRLSRLLYQDGDLKRAVALHATAESEAGQFKKLGFNNPVIVSPNGVNVPAVFEPRNTQNTQKRILFVSRMHPKKGVLELVDAFSTCSTRLKDWFVELVYTTNSDFELEYEAKVKSRVCELGLDDKFIFTGALDDDAKWQAYARADLFVLPTYSENFGIVVAEALWAGVPVITTKGTPWYELEGYADFKLQTLNLNLKCGWWIDVGIDPLVDALREALSLDDLRRSKMGERGHKLVEEKYTWDAVVQAMVKDYKDIVG